MLDQARDEDLQRQQRRIEEAVRMKREAVQAVLKWVRLHEADRELPDQGAKP